MPEKHPDYMNTACPTYLENWPAALAALSIKQTRIPLTRDEAKSLGTNIYELGEMFGEKEPGYDDKMALFSQWTHRKIWSNQTKEDPGPAPPMPKVNLVKGDIKPIRARVQEAIAAYPSGAFVRLGSRSPKDSWILNREGAKLTWKDESDCLRFLLDSERVAEDLKLALDYGYDPSIYVREWIDFLPWQEWRCFMCNRELIGISQYEYRDYYPEADFFHPVMTDAIREQLWPKFREACHLDNVVFDVITKKIGEDNGSQYKAILLEINPFFRLTDPCLYSWQNVGDFDGGVRVRKRDEKPD